MHRLTFVAVAVLALGVVGCDSGGVTDPGSSNPVAFAGDEFAVVGAEDAFANIDDATLDREMSMNSALRGDGGFARHHRHPRHRGSHLGRILRQLQLEMDQREAIRAAIRNHREEIRPTLEALREANRDLIEAANEERREILESLKAGEITREEAAEQLRAVSERTREAIRSNPENEPYLRAMCDAKRSLFGEIRGVLDDAQKAMWDDWVAALDGPCLGDQEA